MGTPPAAAAGPTPPAGANVPAGGVALVTGAARRLGRAIALALAHAGWDVGVHYGGSRDDALDTVARVRALGRRAVALPARLDDEAQVLGLLPALADALGPATCLVNNASRFEFDDAASASFATMQAHWLPNLAAPVLLARELHRGLPAGAEGVVVNLLDQKLYAYNPDFLSYSLSKAGLSAATTMLAQALAPRVRVVGVAPGLTLPSYLQDEAAFEHAHRAHSPLGRSSTVEDVVSAVVFGVGNRSITGATLLVDGGQHLQPMARDFSFVRTAP
jgi:NAD(P)-dependent dehydrogenase (short-subunit alcohol dehydrogenase family)